MPFVIVSDDIRIEYYVVARRLLVCGAFLMLISLPFLHNQIPISEEISILFVLFISLVAGINHVHILWTGLVDLIVSVFSFIFFAYYSVQLYLQREADIFFWINNILSIIFFLATYFSVASVIELLFNNKTLSANKT